MRIFFCLIVIKKKSTKYNNKCIECKQIVENDVTTFETVMRYRFHIYKPNNNTVQNSIYHANGTKLWTEDHKRDRRCLNNENKLILTE